MTRISSHADTRIQQRMPALKGCTKKLLIAMWERGWVPTADDFAQFQVAWRQGRRYRVVTHERRLYMLVRDADDGEFVTVIKL